MDKPIIPLMRSTFFNEDIVMKELIQFLSSAKRLSMGEQCKEFEQLFAEYQECKHAVFVSNGSAANLLLIQVLLNEGKLKRGDRVAVSALTWATNIMPLIQLGLEPVLIDCEKEHLNISSEELLKTLDRVDVAACFITNLLGFCGDLYVIQQECERRDIILLEDNCESLGSRAFGKLLGNFGLASTFSFYVGHHLSTVEGGMVCTNDDDLADALRMARAHGWDRNVSPEKRAELRKKYSVDDFYGMYTFYDLAFNVRPTDIQGFIGITQMRYLHDIIHKREENFKIFHAAVEENTSITSVGVDHMDLVSNFAFPIFSESVEQTEKYKEACRDAAIEIRPIVAGSMAEQPFFQKYIVSDVVYPKASEIHKKGFYVPNHPDLSDEEIDRITSVLSKAI